MNAIARQVGHASLRLADIAPGKSPSFSPNLFKFLRAHGHFYQSGGLLQNVFVVLPNTKAAKWFGAGTLMIGYLDDGFFIGGRLMSALCNGRPCCLPLQRWTGMPGRILG